MNVYLVLYNVASLVGWSYCLYQALPFILNQEYDLVYDHVGKNVLYVQSLALLEILHALLGWVKTPVATTLMQVSSRLLLVWGICIPFASVRVLWAYSTMILAWSVTEIVRYAYYGFNLVSGSPRALTWCRYTLFYILYPLGAGSECYLIWSSLDLAKKWDIRLYYGFMATLGIYVPGFYVMYTHMISQRRKYVNSHTRKQGAKKLA